MKKIKLVLCKQLRISNNNQNKKYNKILVNNKNNLNKCNSSNKYSKNSMIQQKLFKIKINKFRNKIKIY